MVQPGKSTLAMQASLYQSAIHIPASLHLIQLHADVPVKASDGDSSVWALAAHVGALDVVPGSWVQPCPAPIIVAI